jgi:hypothetical protein
MVAEAPAAAAAAPAVVPPLAPPLAPPVAAATPSAAARGADPESAPWPEREAVPSPVAARRAVTRLNTSLSGGARPPATRHTSVAPLVAEANPAKAAAALAEPPRGAPAGATAAEGILTRGQAAFDRGDYPEAVRRGREAIAAGAALGGHLLVGDAYYRLERFPDALREYQAALALDPANASIKRRRDLVEQASAPR